MWSKVRSLLHYGRVQLMGTSVYSVFVLSSRIKDDLLAYESKPTDKREQYNWMLEKKLDGY